MRVNSDALGRGREIIVGPEYEMSLKICDFTVYLGVYNGAPFLDSILEQIKGQTVKDFPLLIVDNCSTDGSWETLKSWPLEILRRVKLVRNPINIGGIGTLVLNLSEVKTRWLITLHQDDIYLTNHLRVLKDSIETAGQDDLVIYTDMGTVDLEGNYLETLIRQSWVADLQTPHSAFIANLMQQSVSYPSAAFRTSSLMQIDIPWHSTSFPDTEITLLQAPLGRFIFIPEQTMLYRMNPDSTSRDLDPRERNLGPFAALCRVLASESFYRLCLELEEDDRSKFSTALLAALQIRLGTSSLCEIVKIVASESMASAWGYSEPSSRNQLLRAYSAAESRRASDLLRELGVFYSSKGKSSSEAGSNPADNFSLTSFQALLDEATPPSTRESSRLHRLLLSWIAKAVPLKTRRRVVATLARTYGIVNRNSVWNLFWKPKA